MVWVGGTRVVWELDNLDECVDCGFLECCVLPVLLVNDMVRHRGRFMWAGLGNVPGWLLEIWRSHVEHD